MPWLEKPRNSSHGDLAFPCFSKGKELAMAPNAVALRIQSAWTDTVGVSKVSAMGPFLNISFDRPHFIAGVLREILSEGNSEMQKEGLEIRPQDPETVIVEYSSPNIAKPFHVGHLRATLVGNCLDRVYSKLGYKVISINHLGDWGTQFGFVWAGCKLWGKPEEPTVRALVELYRRATGLKEEQLAEAEQTANREYPAVNDLARNFFVDLENGEPYAKDFWQWCLNISLAYFKSTYKKLGIEFDYYTGESFYSDKLEAIKLELERKGLLIESQGALGVPLSDHTQAQTPDPSAGEDLGFARIYTPDGRSLYLTRDLATAKYRAESFHFDRALYVVGAPQALHFKQLKSVLKLMGYNWADRIEHIAFGHVLGMKTRAGGEFVELNQFIEEATALALKAYHEQVAKRPENLDEVIVSEKVALAAIIFSNLSKNRLKDVTFNWKHALEFQGDSGPYLLYAYARINGIWEKLSETNPDLTIGNSHLLNLGDIDPSLIVEDCSFQVILKIEEFSDTVMRTAQHNEPNELAEYALELAKSVSKAYSELKVVGTEPQLARARLALFESARLRLRDSLELLGIEPLERM